MARYRAGLETQQKILDSTQRLLSESGFDGITVKAICDASGIQPGSFYNLFPTKDEAVLTVVRQAITAIDPDPGGTGTDTVEELVHTYTAFMVKNPELGRVYVQMAVTVGMNQDHIAGRIQRHHEQRIRRFADAFVRQHPQFSHEDAVRNMEILLAALNGLGLRWTIDPTFDIMAYTNLLIDEFL